MRVALLGDVHANLPALEAVLEHAARQRVKALWNVGDFVGYGAFPDEVVTRLRHASWNALSIVGNYDLKVPLWGRRNQTGVLVAQTHITLDSRARPGPASTS